MKAALSAGAVNETFGRIGPPMESVVKRQRGPVVVADRR